jgi:hypothetical protein
MRGCGLPAFGIWALGSGRMVGIKRASNCILNSTCAKALSPDLHVYVMPSYVCGRFCGRYIYEAGSQIFSHGAQEGA